jgi:DNA polymerase III subunit epsilon
MSRWLVDALARLVGRGAVLTPDQRRRLDAWRALPDPAYGSAAEARWIVIDVESSGLDPRRDALIAVGAVAVVARRIVLGQTYYRVLRQQTPSRADNILVHRIGGTEQLEGEDPRDVLIGMLEFAGKAPCVGYNAPFDAAMLDRAGRTWLGERIRLDWLDLAWLGPAVAREIAGPRQPLDVWLHALGMTSAGRHHALADAFATAQLLLVLERRAAEQGIRTVAELRKASAAQRWLARGTR